MQDDDIAGIFLKNSPNLSFFDETLVEGKQPSFRIIQEAADCSPLLKHLSIHSRNLSSTENLKDKSLTTKPFHQLKELVFYNCKIDESCFSEIRAPNLKIIHLTSMYKLTDGSLNAITNNCPKIEELNLSCDEGVTGPGLEKLSEKLKYLEHLSCYTNSSTLDTITSVIRNCTFLEYCDVGPLKQIYKDRKEFERQLLEICDSKFTLGT